MAKHSNPPATLIPNLGVYHKQARDLRRLFAEHDAAARRRVANAVTVMKRPASVPEVFTLVDAQTVVAHELGFSSWGKLKQRVLELESEPPPDPLRALLEAVHQGDVEAVRRLLDGDASLVDGERLDAECALIEACERGALGIVRLLLEAGADPSLEGRHTTPLLAALHRGPYKQQPAYDVVELLFQFGVEDDHFARAALGDVDGLLAALEADVAIDAPGPLGCTALFLAAWNGHDGVVRALLARGADPSLPGRGQETPLRCAMCHSWSRPHRAVALALIEHGAACTLFDACRVGHLPTVRRLATAESVNAPNELGLRPLDVAILEANVELVELLLALGADDEDGRGAALVNARVVRQQELGCQLFDEVNLERSVFHGVNLNQATFSDVNLAGACLDNVNLGGARIQDAHIAGLTIWGVEVMPLVLAAMERQRGARNVTSSPVSAPTSSRR